MLNNISFGVQTINQTHSKNNIKKEEFICEILFFVL